MESLFFLSGKRTPFGANGGALRDLGPTELGVSASLGALSAAQVDPHEINHVIFGSLLPSSANQIYLPRHIGLKSGVPMDVPALGVNRLCGTGFQVVVEAYQQMLAGDTELALVGGVENMSLSPFVMRSARWGLRMGHSQLQDVLVESLFDSYSQTPMGITAENLAEIYHISRSQSDEFALRSQKLYAEAAAQGKFVDEILPVSMADKKGNTTLLSSDEHPKPDSSMERLAKLKAVFKKDGVVTAGNASGIVDGAAALVVSSEAEMKRRKAIPLGRLVAYGISGCDPAIMGIGPVPAVRIALKRAGLKLDQIDLFEVNEAFAPQALSVVKELEIPMDKLNVNGGAIAVGHPLAASGVRILQTLLYELGRRKKRYGIGTACIGGGQGIALVIESLLN